MKLKFKNQDFQNDAVETVARLFKGQEKANTTFSVSDNSAQYNLLENEFSHSAVFPGRNPLYIFHP